ncbi:MAG: DoxX-like family protein [Verrucomicrobium sp.]|nr:DoxX-like family protein [Verrucomicrobium sp.]
MNTKTQASTPREGGHAPTVTLDLEAFHRLGWIKNAARVSIGLVWIWEGLMPKILYPSVTQFEMVRRSGWWWGSPEETLYWLGVAMIIAGFGIVSGIWERAAALVSTAAVLVLMVLVITSHPEALHDPFGGLVKDACLFTCAALVWWWPRPQLHQ